MNSLRLRSNYDKSSQSKTLVAQKNNRHKTYLKEMLLNKFFTKHRLDVGLDLKNKQTGQPVESAKIYQVQGFVSREFDAFIEQQSFTQRNLQAFESSLKQKINERFAADGIEIGGKGAAQQSDRSQFRNNKAASMDPTDYATGRDITLPKISQGGSAIGKQSGLSQSTHLKKSLNSKNNAYSNVLKRNMTSDSGPMFKNKYEHLKKIPVQAIRNASVRNSVVSKNFRDLRGSQAQLQRKEAAQQYNESIQVLKNHSNSFDLNGITKAALKSPESQMEKQNRSNN